MIGVFIAVLLALTCACRGGTLDIIVASEEEPEEGSGQLRDEGGKRGTSAGARGSASVEDDVADFPQDIAGSFLTCARSDSLSSTKFSHYGCRVERNAQVVNIEKFSPVWALEEGGVQVGGETPQDIFKALPIGSAWQVEVKLPAGQEKGRRVRVRLDFGDGRKGTLSRALAEANSYTSMAQSKVFHVGDRSLLLPLLRTCGLQVSGATTTDTVFKMKLTIEGRKSPANISLGGLCGVDYEGNSVTLKSAKGDSLAKNTIKSGGRLFNMLTPVLEPGTYQLEVASANGSLGYDDFLIGEVMASGVDPQAKIKIEPLLP